MAVDDIYRVALLHGYGTNGSTVITDESGKTWTANGNAQIDTSQFKFNTSSIYFDGTGDYVSSVDHADWYLDAGSNANFWTAEGQIRFDGDPGTGVVGIMQQYVSASNFWAFILNNNQLNFRIQAGGSTVVNLSNAWNPATATWYHWMLVKDGVNGYMMFLDGTQVGTTQTDTSTMADLAGELQLGRYQTGSYFKGWMNEVAISKGIARHTSNFTPPSAPYTPVQPGTFFPFFS